MLPPSIGDVTVYRLDLSRNAITSLPSTIGNITVLGSLDLHDNYLASLPDSFGNLKAGHLLLHDNRLATLPDSICDLKIPADLNLSWNALESLPDDIGRLTIGSSLILSDNRLTSLPASIGDIDLGAAVRDLDIEPRSCGCLNLNNNPLVYQEETAAQLLRLTDRGCSVVGEPEPPQACSVQ